MFRRVFVIYPRGLRTGGPEAMHQLVDALRRDGTDAVLVARTGTEDVPRSPAYRQYDAPEAPGVEDAADCAVVSPEDEIGVLRRFRRATRFCWWLSIDNSSAFRERLALRNAWARPRPRAVQRLKMHASVPYNDLRRRLNGERGLLDEIQHLAQSQYAWSFLHSQLGVLPSLLSDYTPMADFESRTPVAASARPASIAFNPAKSAYVVDRLAPQMPDVRFVPLQGLERPGLVDALLTSTVYLDLGHHPGKDRLPREAALCGAIDVVARRGAAALWADVPLDGEFKVAPGAQMIREAQSVVRRVLEDPDRAQEAQSLYRDAVRGERSRFVREAQDVFVRGRLGEGTVAA